MNLTTAISDQSGLLGAGGSLLAGLPPTVAGTYHMLNSRLIEVAVSARTTREGLGRPISFASHALTSASLPRSTPEWMPRPSSCHSRSSVARLLVALFAYGQPPRPPTEASTVVTPR
jgi:hypothetical protein